MANRVVICLAAFIGATILALGCYGVAYRTVAIPKRGYRVLPTYEAACFFAPAAWVESKMIGQTVLSAKLEGESANSITVEEAWTRKSSDDFDYRTWIRPAFLFSLCLGALGAFAFVIFRPRSKVQASGGR